MQFRKTDKWCCHLTMTKVMRCLVMACWQRAAVTNALAKRLHIYITSFVEIPFCCFNFFVLHACLFIPPAPVRIRHRCYVAFKGVKLKKKKIKISQCVFVKYVWVCMYVGCAAYICTAFNCAYGQRRALASVNGVIKRFFIAASTYTYVHMYGMYRLYICTQLLWLQVNSVVCELSV